jgi:hypothetical protein
MSEREPNLGNTAADHLEVALSNAAVEANLRMSERQWQVLCDGTRRELQERGIPITAKPQRREP